MHKQGVRSVQLYHADIEIIRLQPEMGEKEEWGSIDRIPPINYLNEGSRDPYSLLLLALQSLSPPLPFH